jgi:hypothetical protein
MEQAFSMDIEVIRKGARQHMEKGAVTDDYKADLKTVPGSQRSTERAAQMRLRH